MKKIILLIVIVCTVNTVINAQIPNRIKKQLSALVVKINKSKNDNQIKKGVFQFIANAPNVKMQKQTLDYLMKNVNSEHKKNLLKELSNLLSKTTANNVSNIILKNANIIDVISGETKKGNLFIENDKIKFIDYQLNRQFPQNSTIYDLTGKFIIPGIIDGHVHITHGTYKEAQHQLYQALKHGITSVRDMGGDGRMLGLLKKNNQIGEAVGADVYFGAIIAGPKFFDNDPRPQSVALGAKAGKAAWQRAITKDTDFKQVVAELKGIGSTAIKIYASVKPELIKKVSDEAKKQGLKVWAHAAIPPSKPSDVIVGGADCISHAGDFVEYELMKKLKERYDFKDRQKSKDYRQKLIKKGLSYKSENKKVQDLFKLMKKRNCFLDATLFVYHMGLKRKNRAGKIDSTSYKIAIKTTNLAYKAGVKINAGSDHLIDEHGHRSSLNIFKELELLKEAGLSNIDILRAATIYNAEIVGEEKNIGSIEENKLANIVVLNQNPLKDIRNTNNAYLVIKRGKIIN